MTSRNNNKALTLIELMVSLIIVAMIAVATMFVVSNIARSELRDRTRVDDSWPTGTIREMLSTDLLHAGAIEKIPGGYAVWTQVSLDGLSLETKHLPMRVDYVVRPIGSRNWLVRVQHARTISQDVTELVCSRVRGLRMETQDRDDADTQPASQPSISPTAVTITFDSPTREPLSFVVWQD